jgi:hypothetical protein
LIPSFEYQGNNNEWLVLTLVPPTKSGASLTRLSFFGRPNANGATEACYQRIDVGITLRSEIYQFVRYMDTAIKGKGT